MSSFHPHHFYQKDSRGKIPKQVYIYIHVHRPQDWSRTEIKKWLSENLNSDKTEVMLIGSPHQLRKLESIALSVGGSALQFQTKLNKSGGDI